MREAEPAAHQPDAHPARLLTVDLGLHQVVGHVELDDVGGREILRRGGLFGIVRVGQELRPRAPVPVFPTDRMRQHRLRGAHGALDRTGTFAARVEMVLRRRRRLDVDLERRARLREGFLGAEVERDAGLRLEAKDIERLRQIDDSAVDEGLVGRKAGARAHDLLGDLSRGSPTAADGGTAREHASRDRADRPHPGRHVGRVERMRDSAREPHRLDLGKNAAGQRRQRFRQASPNPVRLNAAHRRLAGLRAVGLEADATGARQARRTVSRDLGRLATVRLRGLEAAPDLPVPGTPTRG